MPGLSPWQQLLLGSQRWGLWKGPSPMQMLPGEKPPAHPPGFVTRSLSLQRGNNSPGLTEREPIDPEEGDYHRCPPPTPASLGRGAGDRGEVVVNPSGLLLGGPAHVWVGTPLPPHAPHPSSPWCALPEALLSTSSLWPPVSPTGHLLPCPCLALILPSPGRPPA